MRFKLALFSAFICSSLFIAPVTKAANLSDSTPPVLVSVSLLSSPVLIRGIPSNYSIKIVIRDDLNTAYANNGGFRTPNGAYINAICSTGKFSSSTVTDSSGVTTTSIYDCPWFPINSYTGFTTFKAGIYKPSTFYITDAAGNNANAVPENLESLTIQDPPSGTPPGEPTNLVVTYKANYANVSFTEPLNTSTLPVYSTLVQISSDGIDWNNPPYYFNSTSPVIWQVTPIKTQIYVRIAALNWYGQSAWVSSGPIISYEVAQAKAASEKAAADKAAADKAAADKAAADKAAAELKAKQEAEAKAKAEAEAKAKAEAEAKAKAEAKASAKAAATKKITITCVKGKTIKKVTAVKPKCPKGYKKK